MDRTKGETRRAEKDPSKPERCNEAEKPASAAMQCRTDQSRSSIHRITASRMHLLELAGRAGLTDGHTQRTASSDEKTGCEECREGAKD